MSERAVLVTGGAGYIGSHAVQHLLNAGHTVVVLDVLDRGHREAVELLMPTAGGRLHFVEGDIGDGELVRRTLSEHGIRDVMHFAAIAYVGESVHDPIRYYRNNTASALTLLEACVECGVERFVFSSTCASYGEPSADRIPIAETCPQSPINPYGWSKLHVERMLIDIAASLELADRPFAFAALRYFNVAGCDTSGLLGEHHEPETHLIPLIIQAAQGKRDSITVFGTDYNTPDGTCIRDYVHVEDLVEAHSRVLDALSPGDQRFYNIGTGNGVSVSEMIESVKRVSGRDFTVIEGSRRAGDPPTLFADPSKIKAELGWAARHTALDDIVASAWTWFEKNPDGYRSVARV